MRFVVGDVVFLKSGGPAMTVAEIDATTTKVTCLWFADGETCSSMFIDETLTTDKPDTRPAPTRVPTSSNIADQRPRPSSDPGSPFFDRKKR